MKYLSLVFLFLFGWLQAQDPYSITYSIDEGLPTSNIYCAFEDDDGFIWFGTDVGVLRYDGYSFEHLSTDDGLGDNEVFKMFKDKSGRIWFLTLNGQLSYYHNGKFTNTKNSDLLNNASHAKVMMDAYENGDDLFFLFRDGYVSKINLSTNFFEKKLLDKAIFGYWRIGEDYYYLSLDAIFNSDTKESFLFKEFINSAMYYRNINFNNKKLFSIDNAVFEFKNRKVSKVNEYHDEIIHMNQFDDKLWLGTRSGLIINNPDGRRHYFKKDVVSYVLKDSQSNYWVTTLNAGIKFIPNFMVLKHSIAEESVKITAIKNHNDRLFIGSEKGLYTLKYDHNFSSVQSTKISSDYIKKIRYYNGRVFAIGNTSVDIFNKEKVIHCDFGANDFYFDGKYYYFSSSVVFKFIPEEIYRFPKLRKEIGIRAEGLRVNTLFRKRTNVILPYKNNSLLFGTSTGLNLFKKDSISNLNAVAEDLNTSILNLYHDSKSDLLYVVTNSLGISVLKDNQILHQITKKQGLSSNTCYDIHPFNDGYLVGTNKGIDWIKVSDSHVEVESINTQFHLKNEKINAIEVLDSVVLLGTDKGLLSFNAHRAIPNRTKPNLVFESILINDKIVDDLSNLRSGQNNLRLSFTGVSFIDFGNLFYQYKDNEGPWIDLDNRNLEIQNLTFGTHNIQIRAKGKSGNWSDVKEVNLFIKTPFWRTIPFLFFISLLIAIGVYFIVGKRIKSIEKAFNKERKILKDKQVKMAIEKQMVDLEQKALRMQMNPHFVFNALNTIKGYYSGGEIKEANKYIAQFSKLLRMILENDKRLITLEKEIEIISLYIELIQLRYAEVFNYKIIVDPKINIQETGIPTLILQPLVENAIIHGLAPKDQKGELIIQFKKENNMLICKVIDDGIGYSESIKSKRNGKKVSKAIQITKERVALENNISSSKNFEIKDRLNSTGTEVIVKLPVLNYW